MDWDEQIRNIKLGTLFTFFEKSMLASILWVVIWYLILLVPIFLMIWLMSNFLPGLQMLS